MLEIPVLEVVKVVRYYVNVYISLLLRSFSE